MRRSGLILLPLVGVSCASAINRLVVPRATANWTYSGCYYDDGGNRTLARASYSNSTGMTIQSCESYCSANGYNYAGTEYGSECYCDYQILSGAVKEPESDCSMKCSGNSTQICGNGNRLSIYYSGVAGPYTNPGPTGWASVGCYVDSAGARTLGNSQSISGGGSAMTVAQCTAACKSAGYSLAGVEYGSECYCDVAIRNSAATSTGCNMVCSGNSTEYCGGSNRINVYQMQNATSSTSSGAPSGWTALGCFTDNAGNRTLATQQEVTGGYTNMTIENCLAVCTSNGYSIGGVEYSQECFCGNAILNGGVCASDQSTCSQPCRGNTAEVCGGSNRLNIFYSGKTAPTASCGAATSTSTSVSSSSVVSTTPVPSSTISTTVTTTSTTTSASPSSTTCPAFWTNVARDLAPLFKDATGACTDMARAAIRYGFHDAATFSTKLAFYSPAAGGSDGSLLLSANEINRTDNDGLHPYHDNLTTIYKGYVAKGYAITAADLIQFNAALGVQACPGGRIGRVYIGRTDTTQAAPTGLLPAAFGTGSDHDTIYQMFQDKGFSARDLAALIGAHSTSIARAQAANGIPVGTPQDTTPGQWDVLYYNQTYYPTSNMSRFASDINLSDPSTTVGKQFKSLVGSQGAWGASFSSAFQALSLLGIPKSVQANMVDCTIVVGNAFGG